MVPELWECSFSTWSDEVPAHHILFHLSPGRFCVLICNLCLIFPCSILEPLSTTQVKPSDPKASDWLVSAPQGPFPDLRVAGYLGFVAFPKGCFIPSPLLCRSKLSSLPLDFSPWFALLSLISICHHSFCCWLSSPLVVNSVRCLSSIK